MGFVRGGLTEVTRHVLRGNQKLLGWILLASAFDGIIFLILIIFDLAKCGFFKRGAKEWLNSIIAEAEAETETEPGTPERPK
ncbi:unnamed protein product, partial [Allacma fusca]